MYPTIISFYTPSWKYKNYADQLQKNCRKLALQCHIEERKDTGNWIKNTRIKPVYIYECLKKLKKPVLWIDVDGSILKRPIALKDFSHDFAGRKMPPHRNRIWHVGTMAFNYTEPSIKLLEMWLDQLETSNETDELNFDKIWKLKKEEINLTTLELGPEYFEMLRNLKQSPSRDTIIAHRASKCPNKLEMKKRNEIK